MDLVGVAEELYGGSLADFIDARTRFAKEARAAGDKDLATEIAALRKPSTAAWSVNMVMRSASDEIERVLSLGDALREAQQNLDGPELRELIKQRQALIGAVVSRVREVARGLGRPISDPVATEVEQTFRAAMASRAAADAVRSGRLTASIPTTADLDLSTLVARVPLDQESSKGDERRRTAADARAAIARERELAAARTRTKEAVRAAGEAEDDLRAAERAVAAAELEAADLRTKIDELRKRLQEAEDDLADSAREVASARASVVSAVKIVAEARRAADEAKGAVERLEGTTS
jgi:hypothetical protein